LSLAIAILLILIAGSFRQLIKRTVAVGVIVTSITGIILVNFLLKNILWLRLVASDPESIIGRIQLMKNAWAMIKAHPLLGVGLNNFTESMMFFDPSGIMAKLFPLVPVHNIYLLIAAETGLLGLAAFLFLLWRAWRGSWLLIPKLPRFEALLCLGMIGGLITLIIHGLSDLVFRLDATLAIFWLFLSLIMALRNRPVEVWGEKSSS
jgi:O-antigen ligase